MNKINQSSDNNIVIRNQWLGMSGRICVTNNAVMANLHPVITKPYAVIARSIATKQSVTKDAFSTNAIMRSAAEILIFTGADKYESFISEINLITDRFRTILVQQATTIIKITKITKTKTKMTQSNTILSIRQHMKKQTCWLFFNLLISSTNNKTLLS
jgi:hypothetical protein